MQTFNLDLTSRGIVPLMYAKQRDVGAKILVTITENRENYDIPQDTQFSVWFSGKSGEGNYTEIDGHSAFSIDGNAVTVELIHQMLNNPGEHRMCLVMNDANGSQRGLWNIPYFVESIPGADSEGAKQYYQAFLAAQQKAEEAADRAEAAAERAESAGGGGADNAVLYTPQTLTEEQQAQARENIGAAGNDELLNIGIPVLLCSKTVKAVAPAYTTIRASSNFTLKKDVNYTITGAVTTDSTDYSAYVYIYDGSGAKVKNFRITHDGNTGELLFIPTKDYADAYIGVETSLTSGSVAVTVRAQINDSLPDRLKRVEESAFVLNKPTLSKVSYYAEHRQPICAGDVVSFDTDSNHYMVILIQVDGKTIYDSDWKTSFIYIPEQEGTLVVRGRRVDYEHVTDEDLPCFNLTIKSPLANAVKNLETQNEQVLFNPFAETPIYHHLNQESTAKCDIPAQSLYDINYAKSLGFTMIEVNPHKCSDGVFVCKHGLRGALGNGLKADDGEDYSSTAFASVSSEWLKSHISYDTIAKYSGHIPTLEEVCAECKKLSMMVKVGSAEAVEVARKYLPDDMIWSTQNTRGDFRGTIEYVWYPNQTIDNCIDACLRIGAPLNIVIASGSTPTDAEIKELTQKAHKIGFTVGMVYPTSADIVKALELGIDTLGSTNNNINLFDVGDVLNVTHLDDTRISFANGASYDDGNDVVIMAAQSTLDVNADNIKSGKLSLRIRYSGSITINDDLTYESDGTATIPYAVVLQRKAGKTYDKWLSVKANTAATIYEMSLSCANI